MLNIGKLLKEKRIESGLSVDDVARITKLTKNYIVAIEDGDITPFSKDLSYLSYYIRHYANAVGVDYETIRGDVSQVTSEWTQTFDAVAIPEEEDKSVKRSRPKRTKKRVDYSFLAFVVASILLVVLFIYLGVRYLPGLIAADPIDKPNISNPNGPNVKPPVEEPGTDKPTPPLVKEEIEIVSVDDTHYEVLNWKEGSEFEFELKFGATKTWVALYLDDKKVADPVSKVYEEGASISLKSDSIENREVMFHLGVMAKNELYLNGEKIVLTEKTTNTKGALKLYFKFVVAKGEVE